MSAWEVVAAMGVFMLVTLPSAALIDYVQAKKKTLREQGLKTKDRNINV